MGDYRERRTTLPGATTTSDQRDVRVCNATGLRLPCHRPDVVDGAVVVPILRGKHKTSGRVIQLEIHKGK